MTKDQLQTVLNLASYELDAMVADMDFDVLKTQEAFDAVKNFWGDWNNNGDEVARLDWPQWMSNPMPGSDEEESE